MPDLVRTPPTVPAPRVVMVMVVAALFAAACSGEAPDAAATPVTLATIPDHDPAAPSEPTVLAGSEHSTAPAIDPSTTTATTPAQVTVRLDVEPQVLGFAGTQGLTGGLGQEVVLVTSSEDSGPGSYREALSAGDRIVRFDPALEGEAIHLQSPVSAPGSNLTLDGSDVDVTVQGHATRFSGTNVVVAGMSFRYNDDVDGDDAITFRDATGTQVAGLFSNRFERAADGLVDVIWNGGNDVYITMCGNWFANHDKAVLIDSGDEGREGGRYYVTMCRNRWTDIYQRTPLSRRALVHQFNSLFERFGKPDGDGGGSKAGGDGADRSEHLLEHNVAVPRAQGEATFDGSTVASPRTEWAGTQLDSDGAVRAVGSWLDTVDGVTATETTANEDEVFSPPYDYPLVSASRELSEVLRVTAGRCLPVRAERISPCAPLVLIDEPDAHLDVVIEGDLDAVESLVVSAGGAVIEAERVDQDRWRVPVAALGAGPVEVSAEARLSDGRTVTSDVAVLALVP